MIINPDVIKGMQHLKDEIVQIDGRRLLLTARMFGVPQMVAAGEQSGWLLALKERAVVVGAHCPQCGQIYAPAYLELCGKPECRLMPLEPIDLPDVGVMADAEPVITLFAPARMNGKAPFAHGFVYLQKGRIKADVAMMFTMETTDGVIRPGIYGKNTAVKLVFKDDGDRIGSVSDVFCLPQKELTEKQLAKTPLFVGDLDWREPKPPVYKANKAMAGTFLKIKQNLEAFFAGVNKSPRNQARLKAISFKVNVVTGGGKVAFFVKGGKISLGEKAVDKPDTTIAFQDPRVLDRWAHGKALTNLFALGDLWISNRLGVRVLEDLDRLWRAAFRDGTL